MKSQQRQIEKLSNLRYSYIDKVEKSWNPKTEDYDIKYDNEIDDLSNQIIYLIKQHKHLLTFEFIIEQLTKLGGAPCLLYDDNGHFAISSGGLQTISSEISDTAFYNFVEKDYWKNNIREALYYFLDNEYE